MAFDIHQKLFNKNGEILEDIKLVKPFQYTRKCINGKGHKKNYKKK